MNKPCLRSLRRPLHRVLRDESGQDLAEMAMIMPILMILVLGIVEFGSLFSTSHTLTSLGREGANMAARGAPLDTVNVLMLENGAQINLMGRGGSITSRVFVQDSVPTIAAQGATNMFAGRSRLGNIGEPAVGLTSLEGAEGSNFYVVELFYAYDDRTPLGKVFKTTIPDTLYSRAIF